MTDRKYRIIEHTADTGFEVRGASKKELFTAAAGAFFHMMWQIGSAGESLPETIETTGNDLEELMVNFLEEFLYRYDARGLVCTRIEVIAMTNAMIRVRAWMQLFNSKQDRELLSVKAVTYHQLYVGMKDDNWIAQIFLDI